MHADPQFRDRQLAGRSPTAALTFLDEQQVKTTWLKLIHEELYRDCDRDLRIKKLKSHPYLPSFLEIIKTSPLTVNYNFDDSLEQLLLMNRTEAERERTRGFEVVDKPNVQFQHDSRVIYHPNGYLPTVFEDRPSPDVVFSDDSFQDQLISAATGKYIHLSNHLFRNTCLLIGLSLEDGTLQSMLRQNAVSNPGNIHYVVHFTPPGSSRDPEVEQAIFRANFESFALYTLFLNSAEIGSLARLIEMDKDTFDSRLGRHKAKYVYYLIGSVGAGKSTAAGNFRSLHTYDEWVDERKPELARPEAEVESDKMGGLNAWIAEQFRKKNIAIQATQEGIHIVDRSPLDPLTFGPPADRPKKATDLLNVITEENFRDIAPGHIIYLESMIDDLKIRNSLKHKYWDTQYLTELISNIEDVYGPLSKSTICTRGRDATAVARAIARVIFIDEYKPTDIKAQLTQHQQVASHE
ncbi:MAG: SIR2 family protein [Sphingomonas bacterium]